MEFLRWHRRAFRNRVLPIGRFYSHQPQFGELVGTVISHPYHRHENKQQSRVTSEESKLVRDINTSAG
jgi:hypothetical protein